MAVPEGTYVNPTPSRRSLGGALRVHAPNSWMEGIRPTDLALDSMNADATLIRSESSGPRSRVGCQSLDTEVQIPMTTHTIPNKPTTAAAIQRASHMRANVGADRNATHATKPQPAGAFPCRATCYACGLPRVNGARIQTLAGQGKRQRQLRSEPPIYPLKPTAGATAGATDADVNQLRFRRACPSVTTGRDAAPGVR